MRVRLRYKQEGRPWQGGFVLEYEHAKRIIADVVRTGRSKYDVFEISKVPMSEETREKIRLLRVRYGKTDYCVREDTI